MMHRILTWPIQAAAFVLGLPVLAIVLTLAACHVIRHGKPSGPEICE